MDPPPGLEVIHQHIPIGAVVIHLMKRTKKPLLVFQGDADAGIGDGEADFDMAVAFFFICGGGEGNGPPQRIAVERVFRKMVVHAGAGQLQYPFQRNGR